MTKTRKIVSIGKINTKKAKSKASELLKEGYTEIKHNQPSSLYLQTLARTIRAKGYLVKTTSDQRLFSKKK